MKRWLLVITLLAVAGLTAACNVGSAQRESTQEESVQNESAQPQSAGPTFATQSNSEKAVAVDVTPLNLVGGGATLDFEMAFNTHSVNLDFDPAAISVLRDDEGREYPAVAWDGSGPGGHHRRGVLRFRVPDHATNFVEVVIHDVAGVPERVFHWDLVQ